MKSTLSKNVLGMGGGCLYNSGNGFNAIGSLLAIGQGGKFCDMDFITIQIAWSHKNGGGG